MRMDGGIGIQHEALGAEITDNVVEGGQIGILTIGTTAGASPIEGNEVVESEDFGIVVNNADNLIVGNEVVGADEAGIAVDPDDRDRRQRQRDRRRRDRRRKRDLRIRRQRDRNRRDRRKPQRSPPQPRQRQRCELHPVAAYVGSEGDPQRLDRRRSPRAGKTKRAAPRRPGAVVRVFCKANVEEGEVAGFLGQATADGSGQWKATYAPQPRRHE